MNRSIIFSAAAAVTIRATLAALDPADAYQPRDTQPPGSQPPPPSEALAALKLPEGFRATLFAGDPDVRQPIDMKIDDRGRVWVCEAYSYKEWQKKGEDRILIFTDTDGDGIADERKIFRGGFNHLSSVEIGFGGVWVLDTPNLIFIADKNGDDVPDGDPQILIEGWTDQGGHNVVNGLTWGLDGWLYGRHGITQPSVVGKPGSSPEERVFIEPGVWRYHPVTNEFEVVLRGMTNPWGLDWDERGEMFMSGNVNGHLWHGIPGALYDRMFGAGSVPHDYERLKMIGERPHYPSSGDWKQDWLLPEKGRDANNELGGGHSHCGLLIYQGDNWPDAYRGQFFLCNTHGRRVNWEAVEPKGSSFISRHRGDVMVSGNQWFRGVSLVCGPDGGVFVSDWCDNGECHDDDGVHRSSGRIYKIVFGQPRKVSQDLASRSDDELAGLMLEKNDWFARHARRLLQERTVGAAGKLAESAVKKLRALLAGGESVPHRLRSLWTLHACMLLTADELMAASQSPDESLRAWAVRLMCEDRDLLESEKAALLSMALHDPSPRVRLYLASVIERVPPGMRWALAEALMKRSEDAADNTVQLEVWHAIEPLVAADDGHAAGVVETCVFPKLRGFITRRIAAEIDDPEARDALGHLLANAAAKGGALAEDVATGAQMGLAGRAKLTAPPGWAETAALLLASGSARVRDAALDLSVAFGDAATLDRLRLLVRDASAPALQRVEGLRGLIRARTPDLPKQLVEAFKEPALRLTALRGFGATGDPAAATLILDAYGTFSAEEKQAAVETLSSRPGFARALLEATASGKIPRTDISPSQARLILALKDAKLKDLLAKTWGNVQPSGAAKEAQIAQVKSMLASNSEVPPDPTRGRAVFTRVCATCHVLFGEGGRLGPDLTGSGRKDLDYLVRNIVDPSAIVPRDYRLTIVTLLNGQVLTGVVPREDDKTLSLQSVVELRVLDRADIAKIEAQPYSWMPEGLLDALSEPEVRDLVAFLQSDAPVPKPDSPKPH